MSDPVRLRFAPSPTGRLHVGVAHTAFFNWLYARHCGGAFVLRIEDTDVNRKVEGATDTFFEGLRWLGIDWDEGPDVGGPFGPYKQSQRLEIYRTYVDRLVESGHAYHCYCSPERLEEVRSAQQARGEQPGYDRLCRSLTEAQIAAHEGQGIRPVVRLKAPLEGETSFHDLIRGDVRFRNELLQDLVLLKSDGYPTYHLANVVDDHLMEITHVMRAEEWISSTPRHMLLYEAFGWTPPLFVHLPLLLGPDKSKLSKRHGATSVEEYRDRGYLPDAMANFLGLIGWSPGDDREKLAVDEMVDLFTIEGITKRAAVFDEQKLDWLNGQYIAEHAPESLLSLVLDVLERERLFDHAELEKKRTWILSFIRLMQPRIRRISEISTGRYFFQDPEEYDERAQGKHWKNPQQIIERLELVRDRLTALESFDEEAIESMIRTLAEEQGVSAAKLIHPVRLAVSGTSAGPGLFELMTLLGREAVIRRLDRAICFLHRRAA